MIFEDSIDKPLYAYRVMLETGHSLSVALPAINLEKVVEILNLADEALYCYQVSPSQKPVETLIKLASIAAIDKQDQQAPRILKRVKNIIQMSFYDQKSEKPEQKASVRNTLSKSAKKRKS